MYPRSSPAASLLTSAFGRKAAHSVTRPFKTLPHSAAASGFRKSGYIFGRIGRLILRTKDDRHHLIIGPTRSGKGAGYVIPNALMHEG